MKFSVPIDAVPQERPRFFNGKVFDPPKSRQFKRDFALLVKSQYHGDLLTGALSVRINIFRDFTKPTSNLYGDIDNFGKIILDSLNTILWKDDRQIVDLHLKKSIDETPRVDIEVVQLDN